MEMLQSAINQIIAAAPPLASWDYKGPDGLMYCGKCNTRRERRINILGKSRIVGVMCQCRNDAHNAEKEQKRQVRIAETRKRCLMDPVDANCTFERDDRKNPDLSSMMKLYADEFTFTKPQEFGLLLYGPVGIGKSYYAACIANSLLEREIPVKMTNFTRIIYEMQSSFEGRQEYLDRLNRYNLLILDDLGCERESEYMQEQVYNIIDGRYRTKLPMIVTTNIDMEEIKNPKNIQRQRIYDRLLEMCQPVKLTGTSRRRRSLIDHYAERQAMLRGERNG